MQVSSLGAVASTVEVLDGLPRVFPYGMDQQLAKFTPRHIEGLMGVDELDGVPLFRLKQTPADVPQVSTLERANFFLSFVDGLAGAPPTQTIVDPYLVFGDSETYEHPWLFEAQSLESLRALTQARGNKTPCAFTGATIELQPGRPTSLCSIIGQTPDEASLRPFLARARLDGFVDTKSEENRATIEAIKDRAFTVSGSDEFDQSCRQAFLDNVIRGGMPWPVETAGGNSVAYPYSRKHGDLERDYHHFVLEPNYLSQGEGFFRDFNQNRRSDVWFFPEVEDANIVTFLSLLQTDGYNPLVVGKVTYTAEETDELKEWLRGLVDGGPVYGELLELVLRPFAPGEFLTALERGRERDVGECDEILRGLLRFCRQNELGDLHEGFWVDHWTYNLDLIDRFLEVYPERLRELLLDTREFTYFDNPDVVLPRARKYVAADGQIRQYGSVVRDRRKAELIASRPARPNVVRTRSGSGDVYRTNLLVKLLSVVANKIATLDPAGIGVMMEDGKPGWCDPLNGLPGLLGSSICETLELERLCRFLRDSIEGLSLEGGLRVGIYEELARFLPALDEALAERLSSSAPGRSLEYWERSNGLKERYWEETKLGVSGTELELSVS